MVHKQTLAAVLFLLIVFWLSAHVVHAQPYDRSLRLHFREQRQEALERLREERQGIRSERRELQGARGQEMWKTRIAAHFQRMLRRLQAAVDRLTKLASRIEQRLTVIKAAGTDVTTQERLLASARTELAAVSDALARAQTAFDSVQSAERPKEAFQKVRDILREAVDHVKNAHAQLVEIITTIKGLRLGTLPSPSASASPASSPTP